MKKSNKKKNNRYKKIMKNIKNMKKLYKMKNMKKLYKKKKYRFKKIMNLFLKI